MNPAELDKLEQVARDARVGGNVTVSHEWGGNNAAVAAYILTFTPDIALELIDQVEQLRATNTRLNRRTQLAESAAQVTVEKVLRSKARALHSWYAAKMTDERDEALARIEAARQHAQNMADEFSDDAYRDNGWAQGVASQARETLAILDEEGDA